MNNAAEEVVMNAERHHFAMLLLALLISTASFAADYSTLVFYRVDAQVPTIRASIKIDASEPVHKLPPMHSWRTQVPSGSHFVYGDKKEHGKSYDFVAGETYYFRVEFTVAGRWGGKFRSRCIKVPAELAIEEMAGTKAD